MSSLTVTNLKDIKKLFLYENCFRKDYFNTGLSGVSTQLLTIHFWAGK